MRCTYRMPHACWTNPGGHFLSLFSVRQLLNILKRPGGVSSNCHHSPSPSVSEHQSPSRPMPAATDVGTHTPLPLPSILFAVRLCTSPSAFCCLCSTAASSWPPQSATRILCSGRCRLRRRCSFRCTTTHPVAVVAAMRCDATVTTFARSAARRYRKRETPMSRPPRWATRGARCGGWLSTNGQRSADVGCAP